LDGHTIQKLLPAGMDILCSAGDENYETDAELLLCFVLGVDKLKLFLNQYLEVTDESYARYRELLRRVADGEPLQYVTGESYFMGHRFAVGPAVLIPRPETEVLCDLAIRILRERAEAAAPRVLDLCTGSGALAISIALALPSVQLTASDISPAALAVARANAEALGASARIVFASGDLFDGLALPGEEGGERYDMIVTNPPYIRTDDISGLSREVRDHEPLQALDGGVSGLDFYHRIAPAAGRYLTAGGILLTEIGWDQGTEVKAALSAAGFSEVKVMQDLSGRDRIVGAIAR
jgi:release factor glutamine methyltransferase